MKNTLSKILAREHRRIVIRELRNEWADNQAFLAYARRKGWELPKTEYDFASFYRAIKEQSVRISGVAA